MPGYELNYKENGNPRKLDVIAFYDKNQPFYEFTNFSDIPVTYNGKRFHTAEHVFHLKRFEFLLDSANSPDLYNPRKFNEIEQALLHVRTPGEVLRIGRKYSDELWDNYASYKARKNNNNRSAKEKLKDQLREQWDNGGSYRAMVEVQRLRAAQNPSFAALLKATGNTCLVEDTAMPPLGSKKCDVNWGWGSDGKGKCWLGQALMEVRNDLHRADNKSHLVVNPQQLIQEARKARQALPVGGLLSKHLPHATSAYARYYQQLIAGLSAPNAQRVVPPPASTYATLALRSTTSPTATSSPIIPGRTQQISGNPNAPLSSKFTKGQAEIADQVLIALMKKDYDPWEVKVTPNKNPQHPPVMQIRFKTAEEARAFANSEEVRRWRKTRAQRL